MKTILKYPKLTVNLPLSPKPDLEVPDVPVPDIRDQPIYALCGYALWTLPTYDAPLLLGKPLAGFIPRHHNNRMANTWAETSIKQVVQCRKEHKAEKNSLSFLSPELGAGQKFSLSSAFETVLSETVTHQCDINTIWRCFQPLCYRR